MCEGPTEKSLFEYLVAKSWPEFRDQNLYIADALGKFNIHRLIALLSSLGIRHSVLMDRDLDKGIHKIVNDFIEERRTKLTAQVKSFDSNLEGFLGIPEAERPDLKPLHVLASVRSGKVAGGKISALRAIFKELVGT